MTGWLNSFLSPQQTLRQCGNIWQLREAAPNMHFHISPSICSIDHFFACQISVALISRFLVTILFGLPFNYPDLLFGNFKGYPGANNMVTGNIVTCSKKQYCVPWAVNIPTNSQQIPTNSQHLVKSYPNKFHPVPQISCIPTSGTSELFDGVNRLRFSCWNLLSWFSKSITEKSGVKIYRSVRFGWWTSTVYWFL